jgi:hypothetical protein
MQPLSQLWPTGKAPGFCLAALNLVRMMGARPVSSGLRMAWNNSSEMRATLAKMDV